MDRLRLGMPSKPLLQRFEAKYLLSEMDAEALRAYMQPYVIQDPHTPKGGISYGIASLYLDGPGLPLLYSSERGEKNRRKLRIRTYPDRPNSPVFFEEKRRVNDTILKHRARVRRECVATLLSGAVCGPEVLADPTNSKEVEALHRFRFAAQSICASPRCLVYYDREAYQSDFEEVVRISVDRNLSCMYAPQYSDDIWTRTAGKHEIPSVTALLEIKFTNRLPRWVQQMIRRFELRRISLAKYVLSAHTLRRNGVLMGGYPIELSA